MDQLQPPKPTLTFRFFQAYALVGAIPFIIFTADAILRPGYPHPIVNSIGVRLFLAVLVAPLTVAVGVLCTRRAQGNIIGWLLIALGYSTATDALRIDFGTPLFRAMVGGFSILYYWMTNLLIPCYFPTGRLVPPKFEQLANRLIALVMVIVLPLGYLFGAPIFRVALNNDLARGSYEAANPLYIPIFSVVQYIGVPLIFTLAFYGIGSLFLRYRRSDYRGRLQLRWLLASYLLAFGMTAVPSAWVGLANVVAFSFIFPLTIGYAILRHRLYDIDIIIRRTLIYSILSAILTLIFFGGVTLAQSLFRAASGQSSDLAIVVSTLAIAALFTPLRRRVQNVIDRRFFRRKYDAEKTLAQFSQTLREETDLASLQASMIGVVQETMQPTQITLWVHTEAK
ncbi:MAG: hypothetical protein KF726_00555 [Anaerolineae bacterium]|nr:hypothetical protein [Anaerolineae bacterium]